MRGSFSFGRACLTIGVFPYSCSGLCVLMCPNIRFGVKFVAIVIAVYLKFRIFVNVRDISGLPAGGIAQFLRLTPPCGRLAELRTKPERQLPALWNTL